MDKINYDFSSFISAFALITSVGPSPEDMLTLKKELNSFFRDSKCKDVLYTTNTDKMFFGIKVIPIISADDIYDYLIGSDENEIRLESYIVELDSKLFDPIIGLQAEELLAILLREVSHLVGSSEPIKNARETLNIYLAANRTHLNISQSIHYKEILGFGLKDYLSKANSIFYMEDPLEIHEDDFILSYGLSEDLSSAYSKIFCSNIKLYENCNTSKFIVFSWTLDLYKNIKTRRIETMHTLNMLKALTGSRLEKMEIDNVIRRINRIDDDSVITESTSIRAKIKEKLKKARLNNLRIIDSTFYELLVQVRNVEDENDALYLMRQINNNISIIEEYKNSKDCDSFEIEKWDRALEKFIQLRDKLTNAAVCKNKTYGIFVNYPDIAENRY